MTEKKISSHRVKIIRCRHEAQDDFNASQIEYACQAINDEALKSGMVIMNCTFHFIVIPDGYLVHIICQWINRVELESMAFRQNMMGNQRGGNH